MRTGRRTDLVRHRAHRGTAARPVPTRLPTRRWSRRRQDAGNSSIELVLFMPLLFFAIFATVQFGLMYLGNSAASSAAREAARVARAGGGGPEAVAAAQAKGQGILATIGKGVIQGTGDITVQQFAGDPDEIEVTVTVQGVSVIPGLPTPDIEQVVRGPVEEFDADD